MMQRRSFLGCTAAALAMPSIARGDATQVLKFVPQADLAVLDPVWTTTYQSRERRWWQDLAHHAAPRPDVPR
jgi:peptide/nickel transport system substrate-binding protein